MLSGFLQSKKLTRGIDTDGHVAEDDWKQALQIAATELARKDFLEMYDFVGKGTLRETVLNILALSGPLTKQQLRDAADGKNIYNEPYILESTEFSFA